MVLRWFRVYKRCTCQLVGFPTYQLSFLGDVWGTPHLWTYLTAYQLFDIHVRSPEWQIQHTLRQKQENTPWLQWRYGVLVCIYWLDPSVTGSTITNQRSSIQVAWNGWVLCGSAGWIKDYDDTLDISRYCHSGVPSRLHCISYGLIELQRPRFSWASEKTCVGKYD